MSISQKGAVAQLLIFSAVIAGWLVLFITSGTVFFWLDDTVKMAFYIVAAVGFGLLVLMNAIIAIFARGKKPASDERDKTIWRKASLWATGVSYTFVVVLLLILSIIYMEQGSDVVSVYFPLFIVLIGGVVLVLTQAIAALVYYNRMVSYGEG